MSIYHLPDILFRVDLSAIHHREIGGMEAQAKRHWGVDETSSTSSRPSRTRPTICSVQVACNSRGGWRVDLKCLAYRSMSRYPTPPMLGPSSTCKFSFWIILCMLKSASDHDFVRTCSIFDNIYHIRMLLNLVFIPNMNSYPLPAVLCFFLDKLIFQMS